MVCYGFTVMNFVVTLHADAINSELQSHFPGVVTQGLFTEDGQKRVEDR